MSSNIPNEIEQATRQLQAAVKITHDVTHGDENTEIAVDSGTIPTLRKRLKEIEQDWAQTADPLADDLASTVQVTKKYKDDAAQSASDAAAELTKVQEEGATQISGVQSAGTAQVQAVNEAGTTQTGAVNSAGAARLEEISEAGKTAEQAAADAQAIANQFGDVSGAIAEATAQADRSKSEADRGTAANNAAQIALSETQKAKDDTRAIAYEGEYSQTPRPGSVAVADSKGHLDIGWTPLLQAMYPYSGVIGSVDKNDLFFFSDTSVNAFKINPSTFNIMGKYVNRSAIWITLSEAESTADRAIAFDDIFLDWNGNIQTYRSITPHRTTTGYDRDAIAAEHGYKKVQTGVYKTGDTYALLLGRIARRNQGGFHPIFNPEGTAGYWNSSASGAVSKWYDHHVQVITTSSDACFDLKDVADREPGKPFIYGGKLSSSNGYRGRPDLKSYDTIYAGDFTPLHYSAKNVVDRQALLFDSFNRAVAGETFSGAETYCYGKEFSIVQDRGTPDSDGYTHVTNNTNNAQWSIQNLTVKSGMGGYFIFHVKDVNSISGQLEFKFPSTKVSISSGIVYLLIPEITGGGTINTIFTHNTDVKIKLLAGYSVPSNKLYSIPVQSARPQFLMVDIIGTQEAWPEEWKEHGLPGDWLSVAENGESLIPDGTRKNYKLSRKCLEFYEVLESRDKGVTWTRYKNFKPQAEGSGNTLGDINWSDDMCVMVFYRTIANPYELTDSKAPLLHLGSPLASNHASRNSLVSALTGKVPVGGIDGIFSKCSHLTQYLVETWHEFPLLYPSRIVPVEHDEIGLTSLSTPAAKMLPYLSHSSSTFEMGVHYKEMKHNGTSWGDDNKFNIVDKQSTVTDLNGETVIVGTKRVELPYQFDGVQY